MDGGPPPHHGCGSVGGRPARLSRRSTPIPKCPACCTAWDGMGIARAILSNGEPAMLGEAVRAAGIDIGLDAVLSVETVRVYKPDPRVYRLAVGLLRG